MDDPKTLLEYALTQAQLYYKNQDAFSGGAISQFNNVLEECSKLNLLPDGAVERLIV